MKYAELENGVEENNTVGIVLNDDSHYTYIFCMRTVDVINIRIRIISLGHYIFKKRGANMLFENKELQSMYDLKMKTEEETSNKSENSSYAKHSKKNPEKNISNAGESKESQTISVLKPPKKKTEKTEKLSYIKLGDAIFKTITEILEAEKEKKDIRLTYSECQMDVKKLEKEFSNGKTGYEIMKQLRRNEKNAKGICVRLENVFEIVETEENKLQYMKIVYLFYMLEKVVFGSKKIIDIFAQPALDSIDSLGTDNGKYVHVLKEELKLECSPNWLNYVSDVLNNVEKNIIKFYNPIFGRYLGKAIKNRYEKEKNEADRKVIEEMVKKVSLSYSTDDKAENNLIEKLYLQILMFEKRCLYHGKIDALEYDLKSRTVLEEIKLSHEYAMIPIRLSLIDEMLLDEEFLQFVFQKETLSNSDKNLMKNVIFKLYTYIKIIDKHYDNLIQQQWVEKNDGTKEMALTFAQLLALLQEIICAKTDNPIEYTYPGYHNSKKISIMRTLEKGHGKPLYIIQELVLCRKFFRGYYLIDEKYGEQVIEFTELLSRKFCMILIEIFSQKSVEDVIKVAVAYQNMLLKICNSFPKISFEDL